MKSNWPSKLILRFTSNKQFISNLLIYIILLSKTKNNFTIGPLITDNYGEIHITHDIMKDTITSAEHDYPMDYKGTLEDCIGFEVIVENLNEINIRIDKLRGFYPDEADTLENLKQNCSNSKHKNAHITYTLPINCGIIEVEL
jgi:hypothetical protein